MAVKIIKGPNSDKVIKEGYKYISKTIMKHMKEKGRTIKNEGKHN